MRDFVQMRSHSGECHNQCCTGGHTPALGTSVRVARGPSGRLSHTVQQYLIPLLLLELSISLSLYVSGAGAPSGYSVVINTECVTSLNAWNMTASLDLLPSSRHVWIRLHEWFLTHSEDVQSEGPAVVHRCEAQSKTMCVCVCVLYNFLLSALFYSTKLAKNQTVMVIFNLCYHLKL